MNIDPENHQFLIKTNLPNPIWQGRAVNLPGGTAPSLSAIVATMMLSKMTVCQIPQKRQGLNNCLVDYIYIHVYINNKYILYIMIHVCLKAQAWRVIAPSLLVLDSTTPVF